MEIPLVLRLKKKKHKDIAEAQDVIVNELYNLFDKAVLHGGTAIWRCYGGNRFSEDIDVYIPKKEEKINSLFEKLKEKGFIIHKKKIGKNSLFSNLEFNRTIVRFEALFKTSKNIVLEKYETYDGNFISIYTLSPEELIKEKVEAYFERLKIRDLYDIFFLLRKIKNKKEIHEKLRKLTSRFKEPKDEDELKVLILEGIIPTAKEMFEYIRRIL